MQTTIASFELVEYFEEPQRLVNFSLCLGFVIIVKSLFCTDVVLFCLCLVLFFRCLFAYTNRGLVISNMLLFFRPYSLKSFSKLNLSGNLLHFLKHKGCIPNISGQSHDTAINLVC